MQAQVAHAALHLQGPGRTQKSVASQCWRSGALIGGTCRHVGIGI